MVENNDESMNKEESFEELLKSYEKKAGRDLEPGDRVSAKVLSVGRESVFVDTGTTADGVVDKAELIDEDGNLTCQVGDILDLYVVSATEGEVRLSRAVSGTGGIRALKQAFESHVPVEGKVRAQCKGGFEVNVMQRRAFCPASQMDIRYAENPGEYVGKTLRFLITKFEEGGRNIVLSRRQLLEQELEKERHQFLAQLKPGATLDGKVTRLASFGAFVEVFPGIEGLVHLSEMSWSHVRKPDELFGIGQDVKVKVLSIENEGTDKKARISLSVKGASPDPWESVGSAIKEGQILTGEVTRCTPYGAFVEVLPGVEGLVHISEMSYRRRVLKPEELVAVGDRVEVMVKEIDKENRRISLSMKDVEGDPWVDIQVRYREGQVVEGKLEKKERFGFFVSIEPGVTGLIPKTTIDKSLYGTELEKLKEGNILKVTIEKIDQPERKITLSPVSSGEEVNWKSYGTGDMSFGSLAKKLRKAMDEKEKR